MKVDFKKRMFGGFLGTILILVFMTAYPVTAVQRIIAGAIGLALTIYLFVILDRQLKVKKEMRLLLMQTAGETEDLYNNAPCGYFSVNDSRVITKINQTLLNWLGYTRERVVNKMQFEEFLSVATRFDYLNSYREAFEGYKKKGSITDREFDFQRKDGSVFNVIINSTAVFSEDGRYLSGRSTVIDNTERLRTKQHILGLYNDLEKIVDERTKRLSESERIYRVLAASIPGSAITLLDREERYLLAEGEMLERMGYRKETMLGKKLEEIISPENYEFYGPLTKRAFQGETISMEKRTLSGFDMLMNVVPLKNEANEIFAVMYVYINLSEIKMTQAALMSLNNTLEQKVLQRTEELLELNKELEGFTYSVSHDLRTPLRAISGYGQMLKEDFGEVIGEEGVRQANLILVNTARMGRLIDDLLDFSKLGRKPISRMPIDMQALVDETVNELTATEDTSRLEIVVHPLTEVTGDISMIKQVWVNLIANALKYSGKKDVSRIEINSVSQEGELCYSIKDNGAGFEMKYAGKLFGVFQRLHKNHEFEGTGVGLALVKTIIKKHGGRIWADAKLNEGAVFYFTLPV